MTSAIAQPAASVPVFRAADFFVEHGANMGDELSFAAEVIPDDIYWCKATEPVRLALETEADGTIRVGEDTEAGTPGSVIHLDSCLTFMGDNSETAEMLVLVEVDSLGHVSEIFALPFAPMLPRTDYRLVRIDTETQARRFAEVACVSFTRGTRITMASGMQMAIEDLSIGDRVLTRDDGVQAVRWIGHSTVRAVGEFAPILISAGILNNDHDLIVSPDHRLFIYQRQDTLGAGRHEVLVRARHLVNGESILQQQGGFVEYYQLLFDSHQIIYAEGIAAETLLIDTRTRAALPPELDAKLSAALPGHSGRPHLDFEVQKSLLDRPDAARLLRAASER
ncbi:Hint domain-containing protein [Pseudooceanicola sp.]|uniref:Hint domain-containing protein n=1 Tax=Pseudooceanicola sp. TaxID=1914328 RepID=UPI00262BA6A2|nr:Hint domain-containing protein [Pseudooceanicola sp.]MDF1854343.1 Hint domain-containing protein [Pseudooceanicola sp.]